MLRRNQVLDKISSLQIVIVIYFSLCNSILSKIEDLQNIVELEEDGIQ